MATVTDLARTASKLRLELRNGQALAAVDVNSRLDTLEANGKSCAPHRWRFDVVRDKNGLISHVNAEPLEAVAI